MNFPNSHLTPLLVVCFLVAGKLNLLNGQAIKVSPQSNSSVVQHAGIPSGKQFTPLFKSIDHAGGNKWATKVMSRNSREHALPGLENIKEEKWTIKYNSLLPVAENEKSGRAVNPRILNNFEANWSLESTPPDNALAISNSGFIVSANNDGIEYYNSSGTQAYFDYWTDFIDDASLTSSFFDPKLIYDSGADRFVLILIHGSSFSTSKVLVCFSKTNNPQQGWWIYSLTGNPLNNNCWFDYPALGVSTNEIYITGNLFKSNSFNQSVIYQITKQDGYNGNTLTWQYWSGLSDTPYEAFSLVPASYGQEGNYGPGIYLVSNESTGDNKIRFWDLTDDLSGTPQLNSYTVASEAYSPAADALQKGSQDKLDNGDCRILQAFYLDGIVQFVFHSDIGEGWNGINYNRLKVSNTTLENTTFGLKGSYDYAYPSLVSFSTQETDPSVMICFLRSSSDIFPQARVVNCDENMNWSESTLVKSGETFIDFLNDDERWGDYTGISRKHNSAAPRIWLAGSYGANIPGQSTFNTYKTWIAEVVAGETVGVEPTEEVDQNMLLYPNPAYDFYYLQFINEKSGHIVIELFDLQGVLIKTLFSDQLPSGENTLRFNREALSPGTYQVIIRSNQQTLKHETLVVAE